MERIKELRRQLDSLQRKDRHSAGDLRNIAKIKQEMYEVEFELYGSPATVDQVNEPLPTLENALGKIRAYFQRKGQS